MALIENAPDSLRNRQKSRRRREILDRARELFETDGYDSTTMARIAEAAEVSTPTVFNYFGSKDGVIVELVLEGHVAGREAIESWQPDPHMDMGEMLGALMCYYLKLTMDIAGKRVWRYAEATNIRRHNAKVVQLYEQIEANHVSEIARFIRSYAPDQSDRVHAQCDLLASVIYHHWNALFFTFIRTEERTLEQQYDLIRHDMSSLAKLITFET